MERWIGIYAHLSLRQTVWSSLVVSNRKVWNRWLRYYPVRHFESYSRCFQTTSGGVRSLIGKSVSQLLTSISGVNNDGNSKFAYHQSLWCSQQQLHKLKRSIFYARYQLRFPLLFISPLPAFFLPATDTPIPLQFFICFYCSHHSLQLSSAANYHSWNFLVLALHNMQIKYAFCMFPRVTLCYALSQPALTSLLYTTESVLQTLKQGEMSLSNVSMLFFFSSCSFTMTLHRLQQRN